MTVNKQKILDDLHIGVTVVSFTKVNGDRRDMHCTLNEGLLPERVDTTDVKPVRKVNPDVQSVWDVKAKGWRSFRWANIIEEDE